MVMTKLKEQGEEAHSPKFNAAVNSQLLLTNLSKKE